MGGGEILRLGVQKLTLGVKIIVSPPSGEGREGEKGFFRCFWGLNRLCSLPEVRVPSLIVRKWTI